MIQIQLAQNIVIKQLFVNIIWIIKGISNNLKRIDTSQEFLSNEKKLPI
jgi:hypothetical protein